MSTLIPMVKLPPTLNSQLTIHTPWKDLESLIDRGADINADLTGASTLLHDAIDEGKTYLVELLLAKGADANKVAVNQYTPLNRAVLVNPYLGSADHQKTLQLLLQYGAEIDGVSFNRTPLMNACTNPRYIGLVEVLLQHGANPNNLNEDDMTPLKVATLNNAADTIARLLNAGADIHHKDSYGNTVVDVARVNNCSKALAALECHLLNLAVSHASESAPIEKRNIRNRL